MDFTIRIIMATLTIAYPIAIYIGMRQGSVNSTALIMAILAALHSYNAIRGKRSSWLWVSLCVTIGLWTWAYGTATGLKLYPVLISLGMLAMFGASLLNPPNVIERFARLQNANLTARDRRYTKQVCKAWCVFFLLNGSIAGYLALAASDKAWMLYTGLLSYIGIGVFFGLELIVRFFHHRSTNV